MNKSYAILLCAALLCGTGQAAAEKICVKTNVNQSVNANNKVKLKLSNLVKVAITCPTGFTEVTDLSTAPGATTQTGIWNLSGPGAAISYAAASISFPRKLVSAPAVEFVEDGTTGAHCTGTAAAPTAPSGYLCIYESVAVNLNTSFSNRYWAYNPASDGSGSAPSASVHGTAMYGYRQSAAASFYGWGTWAVTGVEADL